MIPDEPVKRCCTCHEIKPLISFYRNKSMRDGFTPDCKLCRNKASVRYQQTDTAKAKRAVYNRSLARKEVKVRYRHSAKGKAARRGEAERRRQRQAASGTRTRVLGDNYKRNDSSTRQLRSLCARLTKIIFEDSLT